MKSSHTILYLLLRKKNVLFRDRDFNPFFPARFTKIPIFLTASHIDQRQVYLSKK